MLKKILMLTGVATWALSATTFGNVIVKLDASDAGGQPSAGTVSAGDTLSVEVFLSVDAADDPLMDLRGIQFDFTASSPEIEVSSFQWLLEPELGDVLYVQFVNLPSPGVAYTGTQRSEGLILDLTTMPMRVASFDIAVNGTGTLNVIGSIENGFTSSALVRVDFAQPVTFTTLLGNLTGGTLDFSVGGAGGSGGSGGGGGSATTDSDSDGVPDTIDAFPNDPTETTDTDGDGVGDVADAFPNDPTQTGVDNGGSGGGTGGSTDGGTGTPPDGGGSGVPPLCGAGAAPSMIFMLSVLGFVRGRRRPHVVRHNR